MKYRILKSFRFVGAGDNNPPQIVWTGSDLNDPDLGNFFNPVFDRPSFSGEMSWITYWESSVDGVNWEECDTPQDYIEQFDRRGRRSIP